MTIEEEIERAEQQIEKLDGYSSVIEQMLKQEYDKQKKQSPQEQLIKMEYERERLKRETELARKQIEMDCEFGIKVLDKKIKEEAMKLQKYLLNCNNHPSLPNKSLFVLHCYRPPNIHTHNFTPPITGVIGIFRTLDEATNRRDLIIRERIYEYRDMQLWISFAKIIDTDKDYPFPVGYNEAF